MKNLFSKFIKEERGNVVQYVIVLAVVAMILAFTFPRMRDKIGKAADGTVKNMDNALSKVNSTAGGANVGDTTTPTNP